MSFRSFLNHCIYSCCSPPCFCNDPDKLSRFCFCPPLPSYTFEDIDGATRCVPLRRNSDGSFQIWKDDFLCSYSINSEGNKIAYIVTHAQFSPNFTIIYSHGNACDIGVLFPELMRLSIELECNIVMYDYSGYGESSGKPSEKTMCSDIEAVWRTMTQEYGIPSEKIILFGQSIGTVPTIDLASKISVAGVIVQSPLLSAMKVVCPRREGFRLNCLNK